MPAARKSVSKKVTAKRVSSKQSQSSSVQLTPSQLADHLVVQIEKWFTEVIIANNKNNLDGLRTSGAFTINPYLPRYISLATTGDITAEGIARSLVFSRAFVTSLNTSFGDRLQIFISDQIKQVAGSLIKGIDIEFDDCIDKKRKYAQIKAGPNTINGEDVEPIFKMFNGIKNKAKRDGNPITDDQLMIGVIYGSDTSLNSHYKKLKGLNIPVHVSDNFWERLTGEKNFEQRLVDACVRATKAANVKGLLDQVVLDLAQDPVIIDMV